MSEVLFRCTIPGRAYVKKNTQKVYGRRVVYSENYVSWEAIALREALRQKANFISNLPIRRELNLKAVFFFKNRQAEPDLSALYEGIQDVLQKIGVIENDRLVLSHNGSTKLFGFEPRVEIEITMRGPSVQGNC